LPVWVLAQFRHCAPVLIPTAPPAPFRAAIRAPASSSPFNVASVTVTDIGRLRPGRFWIAAMV
jgi:hypothetical protein